VGEQEETNGSVNVRWRGEKEQREVEV